MTISGHAAMLRICLGNADHAGGGPAYHTIVELLRSRGFAGATVLRGIEGFGARHQVHTDRDPQPIAGHAHRHRGRGLGQVAASSTGSRRVAVAGEPAGAAIPGVTWPSSRARRVTASGRMRYQIHESTPHGVHPAGLGQHLEMVRHGRLADVAAGREVTGTDLSRRAQLAEDRQPRGVRGTLEQPHVRVGLSLHSTRVLTSLDIVKYQYVLNRPTDEGSRTRLETVMIPPEHLLAIEFERTRQAARSRLERLARCARACCTAPSSLLDRIGRVVRRADRPC